MRVLDPKIRRSGRDASSGGLIPLGSIKRQSVQEALIKVGVPEMGADRVARECKGSVTAALLMLAGSDEPLPWSVGPIGKRLSPLVLAAQWEAGREKDREAIARLAATDIKDVDALVADWCRPTGPLVKRSGILDWVAWDFAWLELSPEFDSALLTRFVSVAMQVLSTPDPGVEVAPTARWSAGLFGKQPVYSKALISGIVGSIVLMALHSERLETRDGQERTDLLLRQLLGNDSPNRKETWFTLAYWLPDLAEASPHGFFEAVDALIADTDAFNIIFAESGLFGRSPHTHLLWALERLAWSSDYLGRATVALSRLAARDPGGQLSNRPINSLRAIFLAWHPSTVATIETRLAAIDAIFVSEPTIAWKLCVSLLPRPHDVGTPTDKPRWRTWAAPSLNMG